VIAAPRQPEGFCLVLAHVSDLHLDGAERSAQRAARVMSYLDGLAQPVDAVLVTGDIADHGLPEEYEQARSLLSSRFPVLTCPGNHDRRGPCRTTLLGDVEGSDDVPVNRAQRVAGAVFALCDSSIPGQDEGYLSDWTLAWLAGVLDAAPATAPVVVACHHPPVALHSPVLDAIRQRGSQRLASLLRDHPRVVAVLCGHAHTAAASTFAGLPLLVAPGVASTLRLPWEHGDVLDVTASPALAFHVIDGADRITTHYRTLT
jgi:3',5'-cyclic AMP phosphodiesterase CpdA